MRKEECLGHVQKRVKKRLRKPTKFSKGLPETKADRIAHLYALVIVQHKGETALEIQEALHILLRHTQEKHDTCPGGSSSWCYFQKLIAQHLEESTIPYPKTRAPFLTDTEFQRTVEVFAVYASLAFCETITLGKTQNSNESLHNIIWHNAPKAKRVGQKYLIASTAPAVLSFNEGSLSYSVLMEDLGLKASYKSLIYLATRDRLRNQSRIRRCRETHKRRRRQIVAAEILLPDQSSSPPRLLPPPNFEHFGLDVLEQQVPDTLILINRNTQLGHTIHGHSSTGHSVPPDSSSINIASDEGLANYLIQVHNNSSQEDNL